MATVVATTCQGLKPLRREEIYFIAVAVATATCPTLKGRRREEIYFIAVAVATATCLGYDPYSERSGYLPLNEL